MSLSDEFEYRGAEPDQELWRIYREIVKNDEGDLVAKFSCPDTNNSILLNEYDTYRDMDCFRLTAVLPNPPELPNPTTDEEKKACLNQSEIFHYALAELQKEKLQQGLTLDMPLTPHPSVNMGLSKPKLVIEQGMD